ncbi:MAG TPA: hypothetical protein VGT40_03370 [Methylomirabilota bacterium]|nr:hypothetical protein [Methylomirabilota bacterium]
MPLRVFLIAVLLAATGATADVIAQPLTPHFAAWDRYFSVSAESFERRGQPGLRGYVTNRYGVAAMRVQLLVDSLDASGQVVAQRVEWLPDTLPGFGRGYFELPAPPPASSYRVSVFAFEFIQASLIQSP